MDARIVAFPECQASPHSPIVEENFLPHSPGPKSKISRAKVCPECGKVFCKTQRYNMHVRSHRPMLDCDVCSYKTKEPMRLKIHELTHKKDNSDNECDICHKYFMTDVTLRIHQKKIHSVYVCKYCDVQYSIDEELRNHMQEQHNYTRKVKGYMELSELKQRKVQSIDEVSDVDKSKFTCQFCKKVSRSRCQFKLHLTQHLGISSTEISDELLANRCQLSNVNNDSRVKLESLVSSEATTLGAAVKCEVVSEEVVDTSDRVELLPPVSSTLYEPPSASLGQTSLIPNAVGQPLSVMRSNTTLQSPTTSATNELARPEVILTAYNTSLNQLSTTTSTLPGQILLTCNPLGQPHFLLGSPACNTTNERTLRPYTHNTSAVSIPSNQSTIQFSTSPVVMPAPEIAAGTSFSSNSQTTPTKVLIPLQEERAEDKECSSFYCMYCATSFPSHWDLKQHTINAHPLLTIPDSHSLVTIHKDVLPMKLPINWKSQKCNPKTKLKPLSKKKKKKVKIQMPCDVCGECFHSKKTLRTHKRKHRKSFMCLECNHVFTHSHKLLRHQKYHHKDKYRCRFACGFLSDTYTEIIDHYKNVHDKDYSKIECPHCQKSFVIKAFLMNHLEKCKDCPPDKRPAHVCGNCEGVFSSMKTYNKHAKLCLPSLKKKDQSRNIYENIVRKSVEDTSQNLAESIADDLENCVDTYDDDSYTGSGSNVEEVSDHLPYGFRHKRSTSDYIKCRYCPNAIIMKIKEIEVNHILMQHKNLVTRMTVSPLRCDICEMSFKSNINLCKHLIKHYYKLNMWDALVPQNILKLVKVKNYCWICKFTYPLQSPGNNNHGTNRDININEAFDTLEFLRAAVEPLKCEKCNKTCSTRKIFWVHMKAHISTLPIANKLKHNTINPRLFECTECQYRCRKMVELHRHLASHFFEEIKE